MCVFGSIKRPRQQPPLTAPTSHRSWLPMQPHLLVELDPLRWSQRARADQRWQREGISPASLRS